MTERRYTEDEVAEIFKQATEAQQSALRPLAPGEGMTLADLQAIGEEVGVPPELVARAASALDAGDAARTRRFLGIPIGVGRTVHLGRFLTEDEWERLVIDLRRTFDARGTIRHEGTFHSWTNGNLQVLLEPTATGHQLRMRTFNGRSSRLAMLGVGALGIAAATALATWSAIGSRGDLSGVLFIGLVGAVSLGMGVLPLPRWAQRRARQMEEVAARAALESADTPER
jgi:hypothetical protein